MISSIRGREGRKPPPGVELDAGSDLAQGLVLCLLMNEGAGSRCVNLAPGYGHGTVAGAPSREQGGLYLSASSQKVTAFDPLLGTGDFTFECIARPDVLGSVQCNLISTYGYSANTHGALLYTYQGKINATLDTGSITAQGATALSAGVRYHFCATRAGAAVTVYLNGRADGSGTAAGGATATAAPLVIGNSANYSSDYFQGAIEHARVWSRALTAGEVARLAAEPYAMFAPLRRRSYKLPSTLLYLTAAAAAGDPALRAATGDNVVRTGGKA